MWQDREIRFDVDTRMLRLIPGEFTLDRIENVEDTKGNNGDRGIFRITNLRLIWHAQAMPRINLTIGLNTVHGIHSRKASSKIKGETESMYVTAKAPQTRFEFVFTALGTAQAVSRLFSTTQSIHRAYETTRLYRELKMRGPIVDEDGRLRILPGEQQVDKIEGVWNLSSEQGNLGVMICTNLRVVWFATMSVGYNVSIPYMQLANCRVRDSKFGLALVIDTTPQSGEYILGFRIDPEEKLKNTCRSINSLSKAAALKPFFGIKQRESDTHSDEESGEVAVRTTRVDAFAAYFSDGLVSTEPRGPVVNEDLGLAFEALRPGFTLAQLWEVHVD
ncbi:hypothetical protein PENTCL1PPCAC_11855 [Pristionchus entomophagus]|uniref:BBSome complex member BBS5 PH domain-containing protein n=1 Tax=Pristionchus entomophagus TaxID=358040 RepID=A0AAV5T3N3_9BILA|nr:hypothetical protein PENTCL1PPCAC_11855 [Pristionchus entomophagus]